MYCFPRSIVRPSGSSMMRRGLYVESLEERSLLAVISVTNVGDAGPGSLRQAILDANTSLHVADTIRFNIGGGGVQTIRPLSPLPTLVDPAMIDGTTQPGFPGTPIIQLDGSLISQDQSHGLVIAADNSTVRGLVINRFSGSGIRLTGSGNAVEGSYLGTDVTGTLALGNGQHGVEIDAASNNRIGGLSAGQGNVITANGSAGVAVHGAAQGNAILANSIRDNTGLGIQLGQSQSPLPNDSGDADTGANLGQNYPVLSSAISAAAATTIVGTLRSAADTEYRLQFFSSARQDGSGFGEGAELLGTTTVTTAADGTVEFEVTFPRSVPVGHVVSATATDPDDNTSEFSRAGVVVPVSEPEALLGAADQGVAGRPFAVRVSSASGSSTITTYVFTGIVGDVLNPPVFGTEPISREQPVVGFFSIDSAPLDADASPGLAVFDQSIADGFRMTVDGTTVSSSQYQVRVTDVGEGQEGRDLFQVVAARGTLEVAGVPQGPNTLMQLELADSTGTALDDDNVPDPLELSQFDAADAFFSEAADPPPAGSGSVEFSVDSLDVFQPAGDVTYSIDWGDGAPLQTRTGPPEGLNLSHVYNQIGENAISLTVTDKLGKTSPRVIHAVEIVSDQPPTISPISAQTTDENVPIGPLAFTIGDAETPAAALVVTAVSSDTAIIPNANIVLGGTGANRTVTITPAPNQHGGPVTITIGVHDGLQPATTTFTVQVISVNELPSVSAIADQFIDEDTQTDPIPLTVGDAETPAADLTVTATSDNRVLLPDANITVAGTGADRTIVLRPAADRSGQAVIQVTVADAEGGTAVETLVLTVAEINDPPTLSAIPNQTVPEDGVVAGIPFVVGDAETPANALTLTATSFNPTLVPNENIVLAGSGTNRTVTVRPVSDASGSAIIAVLVADSAAATRTMTFQVIATPVNDAPVNIVPGPQQMRENRSLLFSSASGNSVTIRDVDAAGNDLGMILTVGTGTLSLGTTEGLRTVQGNGTGGLTISGSISALNAALDGLTFTPPAGFTGQVTMTIVTHDLGNSGAGGDLGDTDTVKIDVLEDVAQVPPTASMVAVEPEVRAGAVDQLTVIFSAPVTGFDLGDLTLLRFTDDSVSLLPGEVTLSSTDGSTWTLDNLTGPTADSGMYVLTLDADGAGIQDEHGTSLVSGASVQWVNGAGDANQDSSFDQRDLVAVLQAGRYLTGQPATWRQGDWNGDGVFDPLDIVLAQQTSPPHYLQGPFAALAATSAPSSGPDMRPTIEGGGELDVLDRLFAATGSGP